jgi:hypothetical protein
MEIFITIIILAVMFIVFLVTTGYDNFNGITLELDEMYTNTDEMACAVLEELKKQRRECEIIEMGKGYPKFLIDGKKYLMTYKMASISGFPVQVIHLKICKG